MLTFQRSGRHWAIIRARRFWGVFTLLTALTAAATAYAQSEPAASRGFIWKAMRGQGAVYLVGSLHMLTRAYYPLGPALESAFTESDILVEEIDLGVLLAPESQMQLLTRSLLPGNQLLDYVVSDETYERVIDRIAKLGLPLEPLRRFKPWGLALTLLALEWQTAGFDQSLGLDQHFYDRARREGKAVQALETLEFQISRFDGMTNEEQDRLLAETLSEFDTQIAAVTELANAWRDGDADTVEQIVLRDLRKEPRLYESLLVDRNRDWLPAIEALFTRPRPAFVVVGAAHLVGQDGLVAMLESRGYNVEQR